MATIDLSAEDFERTVTSNDIVLVDFWASWCGPCRMFAPVYEKASAEHPDIVFGKVDTEAEQALAAAAQITLDPHPDGVQGRARWCSPSPARCRPPRWSRSSPRSATSTSDAAIAEQKQSA